jgi:hypothetical protein
VAAGRNQGGREPWFDSGVDVGALDEPPGRSGRGRRSLSKLLLPRSCEEPAAEASSAPVVTNCSEPGSMAPAARPIFKKDQFNGYTATDVKNLRERTGAGMMDCKKALDETGGDMEAAVDLLRAKGLAAAAKKSSRTAAEGLVGVPFRAPRALLSK